jgi:hypothetical protein
MGFELLLKKLLQKRSELALAVTAFKAWFRLTNHHTGRPGYPEPITWAVIQEYLDELKVRAAILEEVKNCGN